MQSKSSKKHKETIHISIEDQKLVQNEYAKYLRVYIDCHLSWGKHIEITKLQNQQRYRYSQENLQVSLGKTIKKFIKKYTLSHAQSIVSLLVEGHQEHISINKYMSQKVSKDNDVQE